MRYLLILIILLPSLFKNEPCPNQKHNDTIDDMVEWIHWDMQEGLIDSAIAVTYLENLKTLRK